MLSGGLSALLLVIVRPRLFGSMLSRSFLWLAPVEWPRVTGLPGDLFQSGPFGVRRVIILSFALRSHFVARFPGDYVVFPVAMEVKIHYGYNFLFKRPGLAMADCQDMRRAIVEIWRRLRELFHPTF